jgi:hypothetical protein
MKSYAKFTAVLIAVWFTFALYGSALHLFKNNANRVGLAVGVAAVAPIVVFFLWLAASDGFRKFALSLDPRVLTYVQSWRVVGVVFVILAARGVLPRMFALPAGYGDIAIGLTASLVAWKLGNPGHRNAFILWQALGITDLVTAVGLGTTAGLIDPHGIPMVAMTVLPLSLIPTFLVPLFLILHVICIAQARSWKDRSESARPTTASSRGDLPTGGLSAQRRG